MLPRRSPALLVASSLALALACAEPPPPAVRAGDIVFSEDDLLGLSPDRRERLALLAVFGQKVAAGETSQLGAPLIEARLNEALLRLLDAQEVLDAAGADDAVLRARYSLNPAYELTVRHLIVLSERYEPDAARAQARAKAARALERVRAGEAFPDVAAEVSQEPGAEGRQGLLTPGREGAWVDEFWRAANALRVGEVSGVVETRYGFHVLRLEGRDTVPFEEARPRVLTQVAAMIDPRFDRDTARAVPDDLTWGAVATHFVTDDEARPEAGRGSTPRGDTAALATWLGHRYTLRDHRRALAALDRRDWRRATAGPSAARRAALDRAVARWAAGMEARRRGLAVSESVEAAIRRAWADDVAFWGAALGFSEGMSREEVKRAALSALAMTGQNARLAREELTSRAGLLRLAAPIDVRGGKA